MNLNIKVANLFVEVVYVLLFLYPYFHDLFELSNMYLSPALLANVNMRICSSDSACSLC